jgi:hypothetical protein
MYFMAGNLWLLTAAVVFWGREYRGSPSDVVDGYEIWQLFGVGRNFYAYQYPWMLGALFFLAAVCFVLHWRSTRTAA